MPNDKNSIPGQPTKAQVVAFEVLLGEREYQNKTHPDSPAPTIVDFANLLIEYTDKLAVDATVDPTGAAPADGPLKRLREIAAIALHAMEIYGIQPRENHVPASAGITGKVNIVGNSDATAPTKVAATTEHQLRTISQPRLLAPSPTGVPVAAAHHEAIPLPHHPPGEEHGKK